ncbi:MAG: aldehyde dehydrogenase family protein [candidate division Zixibacteria bacterium]|nr:aldehyde dehydrogenase family protein [candidate division Zixibacteria bacterium]
MPVKKYHNYINGEWVPSKSGRFFENKNPADHRVVLGEFPLSNEEDVNSAVAAAKDAYEKWRLFPAPRRAEILFKAAEILVKKKEEWACQMTQEMGKVLKETRGDVQEAIDMTYYMAGEGRRQFGQTTPAELPNKFAMSVRQPMGVCALITPWNFPMAIPSWKLMPALICGNTVVFKPATDTPLSAYNLIKACEEAGVPRGVVNILFGSGAGVGLPLMKHADVKLVSFTGSTAVGRTVAETCAPSFKHTNLEMGGKNAIIVMDDGDVDLAVEGAVWGGFGTTGQRCTAASRLIVHKEIYREFADKFAARARALKVGNGIKPEVEMGPSVNESQLNTVMKYVAIGKKENKLIAGGDRLDKGDYAFGYFHQPTVFGEVDPQATIFQEEIFGPVVALTTCNDLEDGIKICNDTIYGLSASIYTRDVNKAFRAMRDVYTGIFYVNASTIGAEVHLPFGGTKQTGNGHREAGTAALDVFSEWKSIYVDFSGKLQKAQIDVE